MKKMYITVILIGLLVFSGPSVFAQISFAILPIEAKGEITAESRESAESALYQSLTESRKYKIIERSRIEDILQEQSFQMTGATEENKAVEIGKILGVEKLIASTLYLKEENQSALSFSVIDIATAEVEFSREESVFNYRAEDLARFCASHIVNEYPLLGTVLGEAKGIIVVNLGKNHGIKTGMRLFVARKEELIDESGEVLFQEVNRVGSLRVTKIAATRAQTQVISLEDPDASIEKEDLVSPEPLPKREPVISAEPLLSHIVKGELLLDDDMEERKYLSPTYNQGDSYVEGEVHLNGTHLTTGHTYAYYPTPFDKLENFIIEGAVEFQPTEEKYNKFSVIFRSKGNYQNSDNYNFYWHDEGEFAIYQWRLSNPFPLVPLQSSPAINRGVARNTFRVLAYGSKFDCYLNGEFVIGFEDETLEQGQIGFMVEAYGYSAIDEFKIWEAVKEPS